MANYDPGRVIVTFNGTRLTGFMDGTHIEITRDEDAVMKHTGNDGSTARSINRNRGGSITVTLQQTSPANDVLSAYAAADEATGLLTGSILVKDLFGTTIAESGDAWIKKLPDAAFGKEIQGRAWVFDCGELVLNVGGSLT